MPETPDPAAPDRPSEIATALTCLGRAWRGDWSDFDGRTLRYQLDELSDALVSDTPFDLRTWCASWGICPDGAGFADYCDNRPESVPARRCGHTWEAHHAG